MLMYHKDSKEPIDANPSQVEGMKNDGWTEKPKSKPKSSQDTDEVKN